MQLCVDPHFFSHPPGYLSPPVFQFIPGDNRVEKNSTAPPRYFNLSPGDGISQKLLIHPRRENSDDYGGQLVWKNSMCWYFIVKGVIICSTSESYFLRVPTTCTACRPLSWWVFRAAPGVEPNMSRNCETGGCCACVLFVVKQPPQPQLSICFCLLAVSALQTYFCVSGEASTSQPYTLRGKMPAP